MDYSKLSDQEINLLVAKIEHPGNEIIESKSRPPSVLLVGGINEWFDYCNNPADAWPIIVKNDIGLEKETGRCCDECNEWVIEDEWRASHPLKSVEVCDEKPFRAAMIVFLMMQ